MPVNLSSRAMVASLNISQWTARKLDRKVTDEVNAQHNAADDAGRYNKLLISKDSLAEIQKIVGAARMEHDARTAPWLNDGARILNAKGIVAYNAAMKAHRIKFDSAVEKFVAGYPEYVMDARTRLNGLFKAEDYPHESQIRGLFTFKFSLQQIAAADDFRVELADDIAAEIRADIEANTARQIHETMASVRQRIIDHVGHMARKLKAYEPAQGPGEESKGVFRDSLVENVRELAELLPGLNVTGDSRIDDLADRIRRELCGDDAPTLRKNASARASVAAAAETILKEVSDFIA